MTNILEIIKEEIKDKGFKFTPQRRLILEIIINNQDKHLNPEEIYQLVKAECPEIGLATVYRTLQLLMEASVLSRLSLDNSSGRYELNILNCGHYHLICRECREIFEIETDLLKHLEEKAKKEKSFKIEEQKIIFSGLCSSCY